MRNLAQYTKDSMFRGRDGPVDVGGMPASILVFGHVDAEQHAIAEAGSFAWPGLARRQNAYFGRGAVRVLVPFVGCRDEIAVAVPRGHVGENGGGKGAGVDRKSVV